MRSASFLCNLGTYFAIESCVMAISRTLSAHIALLFCNVVWACDYPFYNLVLGKYVSPMAMVLTAKVGDSYYTLGLNIPSFNGIAELAPATTTSAVSSKRFAFGKTPAFEQSRALRLGRKIEVVEFSR